VRLEAAAVGVVVVAGDRSIRHHRTRLEHDASPRVQDDGVKPGTAVERAHRSTLVRDRQPVGIRLARGEAAVAEVGQGDVEADNAPLDAGAREGPALNSRLRLGIGADPGRTDSAAIGSRVIGVPVRTRTPGRRAA
jgi:hypothetical protein